MSHTYWDPKGIMKRRPGGYTYYGGNTALSAQYKDRYIPHYNPETTLSDVDRTDKLEVLNQSENWNTYQKRMWYQDNLDHTTPEIEDFPGLHAEWRDDNEEGTFAKSYRDYNSKFVYDFRVDVTTTDADGVKTTQQARTADSTKITKLRRDVEESNRYDLQKTHPHHRKTVDFTDLQDGFPTEEEVMEVRERDERDGAYDSRLFSRSKLNSKQKQINNESNSFNEDNGNDIQYFDQGNTLQQQQQHQNQQLQNQQQRQQVHRRPASAGATTRQRPRHPAVNPSLCTEHPRETFKKKEHFPLFWSAEQREDFRQHRSSSNLLDTTSGRRAHDESNNKSE